VISSRPCTRLQVYVKAVGNSGLATRADRCSIEADTGELQVTLSFGAKAWAGAVSDFFGMPLYEYEKWLPSSK
jgi:hypothetical protein